MNLFRASSCLLFLVTATLAPGQTPPAIVTRATQWVAKNPDARLRIGLAELRRAHGDKQGGIDELDKLSNSLAAKDVTAAQVQELLCWRMLPVAPAQHETFRTNVARLKSLDPKNHWAKVWEIYLHASDADRGRLLGAVQSFDAIDDLAFPGRLGEDALLELLQKLGLPFVQAGLEVVATRDFEPLHALRDLDRALTREADFLRSADRVQEARQVVDAQELLRREYGHAARHVVERLFALNLQGKANERDALLARVKALPFLHERQRTTSMLLTMSEGQARIELIEPLLKSELKVVYNPPDMKALQTRSLTGLSIKARTMTVQDRTNHYKGEVQLRIRHVDVRCEQLTIVKGVDPAADVLSGTEKVRLTGFPDYPQGVTADRFTYHAETGSFTLGGDVRLHAHDKVLKLRTCTLTQRGELRDARSLVDDFRALFTMDAKLELLEKIAKVYDDAELPDDVRYLLALHLLRPHLTWHAPFLPPQPERDKQDMKELRDLERALVHSSPWQEAMGAEKWMLADVPQSAEEAYRGSLRAWYKAFTDNPRNQERKLPDWPLPSKELYFWRLSDPQHPDVARATRLLTGIRADDLERKARRWRAEIERNNTVLTFDIAGAAPVGRAHSLLMDVRNTNQVAFKLYRVEKPAELVHASKRIGLDFIYRDHRLDDDRLEKMPEDIGKDRDLHKGFRADGLKDDVPAPAWRPQQLVHSWNVQVADLKAHRSYRSSRQGRRWYEDRWHDEADSHYFDDECSEHRARLDKTYRRPYVEELSSWQCERIVSIPEKLLKEAGAYVLVAEANGQKAHVPIVVEPISLTLRRCRDGVFVLAADAEGRKPLEGASVHARGMQGKAIADKEGVAFARVFAAGDRALIVHHEGRYAIGGFGHVFEGIYEPRYDEEAFFARDRLERIRRGETKDAAASIYADQHVVVAYTDRPTYRPGQEVQFKLIVRKLAEKGSGVVSEKKDSRPLFRAEDFDQPTRMVLPDLKENVHYSVVDPKGHEVAQGNLTMSDFGSAAGSLKLSAETVVGAYTFRVRIAGQDRLVPEVFSVKHYRRPNFEVHVVGVPEKLTRPRVLSLDVSSNYYFGPPVANGKIEARIARKDQGKPMAEARATLDEKGKGKVELRLPRDLEYGKYLVVCSVTDESGRTVSSAAPMIMESPDAPAGSSGLGELPRFVAVNQELTFTTSAKEIRAEQDLTSLTFRPKNGSITLKLPRPGWYHVTAGADESAIFAYGGEQHPREFEKHWRDADDIEPRLHPKWVNLSDFSLEENEHLSRWERPSQHLYALFDRQTLKAGEKLRMLVYLPYKRAKMLFTLEGRTILDYAIVSLPSPPGRGAGGEGTGYQVVEISIKDRYFPNVYVQGRIIAHDYQPPDQQKAAQKMMELRKQRLEVEDLDPRWCRIDIVRPHGHVERGTLNVQIETDQTKYKPGDAVRAVIKVTDHLGKPQAAELSLAAVDESVFAFGEDNLDGLAAFFGTPHEVRRFLPKVWRVSRGEKWSKKSAEAMQGAAKDMQKLLDQLAKAQEDAIKSLQGGLARLPETSFTAVPLPRLSGEMPSAQIPLARLREHFHETATWLPQLRTDEAGIAVAAFTLPDSLTRYRLSSLALTKETEVGVGRARITAGLPLAVQVFLPRFAIEKDLLQAVAVIHNNTDKERECQIAWEIEGATVDRPGPTPDGWKLVLEGRKDVGTGTIKVAANSTAKLGLWLKLDQIGTAKVAFRAATLPSPPGRGVGGEGVHADGETRTLPIQPLGRPVEFNGNEEVAVVPISKAAAKEIVGKFNKQGRIQLPPGFVAREIHLTLSCSEIAQALEGLDYLVDYPYGCIEQTMSRFMPLVMIQHATRNAPVALRPEISAKLPVVLKEGLTRVYAHQHADGSWGWFEKDSRNLAMSTYVVYGLARCQAAGTKVDADVLRKGCDYLKEELKNKHDLDQVARAWHALALAGRADTKELDKLARTEEAGTGYYHPLVWCNLALACKSAGLYERGERLWAKVHKELKASWWGHDTESFSLILNTQIAFGAPYGECRTGALRILAKRDGTRWYHTRDTAWAIDALANMLGYIPEKNLVRKVEVTIGGKKILEGKAAAEAKDFVYRVHLKGDQIPATEGLEIFMNVDSEEPVHVALRATGIQHMDDVKTTGKEVRIGRKIESLNGEPLKGPLKIGQVVRVRLRLDLTEHQDHLVIEERRPALCEFADDHLSGGAARSAVQEEFRDDRLCVFFRSLSAGTHEIVYYLRAETQGTCSMLPGCAYPMYDEKKRGETGVNKIDVRGK